MNYSMRIQRLRGGPNTVVLTRKACQQVIPSGKLVGETFKVGEQGVFKVTGVLRETNHKSHIVFDARQHVYRSGIGEVWQTWR